MKKSLLIIAAGFGLNSISQTLDSVILGAGYANESYYSLANGEVANVSNLNWDLAFDLSPFGSTIRMNRKTDVLYLYPGTAADWSTVDTAGHLNWEQYIDGYTSWSEGALNAPADISNPVDLGWGNYNTITHITEGSRLFVIKLDDDSYRKLLIETLASGVYTFKYANIDGSNEVSETITKSTYTGQNFIHYSILNETVVDREPASADWDLVFTNYVLELAPNYYSGVTGALSNSTFRTLTTAKVNGVPAADANYATATYTDEANTIGYDWKTFNMGTFSYDIPDSLCYFVKDENDNTWKIVFTGFVGSSNGKIYFTKEQITFASTLENNPNSFSIYPNPAADLIYLNGENLKLVNIHNSAGQLIYSETLAEGQSLYTIPVSDLNAGLYILQVTTTENEIITKKLTIQNL